MFGPRADIVDDDRQCPVERKSRAKQYAEFPYCLGNDLPRCLADLGLCRAICACGNLRHMNRAQALALQRADHVSRRTAFDMPGLELAGCRSRAVAEGGHGLSLPDRKSPRLNSSH